MPGVVIDKVEFPNPLGIGPGTTRVLEIVFAVTRAHAGITAAGTFFRINKQPPANQAGCRLFPGFGHGQLHQPEPACCSDGCTGCPLEKVTTALVSGRLLLTRHSYKPG